VGTEFQQRPRKLHRKALSPQRPATLRTPATMWTVSNLITADRSLTFDELQHETCIAQTTLHDIIHTDLKVMKMCAHWVPWDLTQQQKQKQARVEICCQLLALHH
jgi:hypothetical protein